MNQAGVSVIRLENKGTYGNWFLNVELYQYACEFNCLLVQSIEDSSGLPSAATTP